MTPFTVQVSDAELADLRQRLARTRWPEPATVAGWNQGVPVDWLRELCAYWETGYDWRRLEARLNARPQVTTEIDGVRIHTLHVRSERADAVPLLLSHGWPGSVVEFLDVTGPLAEAGFHVVCPSLPGFGFSGKPTGPGWTPARIADTWVELMSRLGYDRFGAQGGDWGSAITMALAARHPERLVGIHLNNVPVPADPSTMDSLTEFEQRSIADTRYHLEWGSGYALQQGTRPQTLGYGLLDSPAGQAGWIAEKYWAWTDHDGDPLSALSRDQMLDNISVYWHTASAASSARIYWEDGFARPSSRRPGRQLPRITVPTGISIFPKEIIKPSRRWCEPYFTDLRTYEVLDRGGHFAAWEQPALFVEQVRSAFLTMR